MPQTVSSLKPFIYSPPTTASTSWSKPIIWGGLLDSNLKTRERGEVVCFGMLAPRKFLQKRKKVEVFKDAVDEADQRRWRKLMNTIDESGSAVSALRSIRVEKHTLPKDLVVGTLVRFKQLKRWDIVSEILEWLWLQHCWDFGEVDFLMLMTAYGKQGEFNKAETVLNFMTKKGYPPNVISHTALMEAYGRGGQYDKAEATFRRMQSSGPEPSVVTYQIILKTFVEGDKFEAAEEIFETLLNDKIPPLRPDQKMFHMMIYLFRKARNYEKARKMYALMAERGVQRSTVTYNSLMSFETSYKEVANIYDEMQRAGVRPDVVSYTLLVSAYGKARREEEALAVFEEMLDAGVRPTQKAYNILLHAFALCGMVEQARIVFKSMRRDRCTPDLYSYNTMLLAYVNAPDMEGAEKFFRRIKDDGFELSVVAYGTLIVGYAKANNLEKMMETYEKMRVSGIKANQFVLTTIMDAYGRNEDFDSAVVWFKDMESCGVVPDKKAKNVLLSLAKTAEELTEARQLVGHTDSNANENTGDGFPKSVVNDDDDEDQDQDDDYHNNFAEEVLSFQ